MLDTVVRQAAEKSTQRREGAESPRKKVGVGKPEATKSGADAAVITQLHDDAVTISTGEKGKARDILAALEVLGRIAYEHRLPTDDERNILLKFGGFGAVALGLFPDPITGHYKDASWQALGEELQELLTAEDYESAKRTTFNAFYTSPTVVAAMHDALLRLGVSENALILEPGCGSGNFLRQARPGQRFLGIELDTTSARIAKVLYPEHEIRNENFKDTKLPPLDAVIGNVPFANITLSHHGQKFSLHDYFFAKSVDALKPGGVLALVTSHFTLDKQNAAIREYLADRADFLGAIRLPSTAFKNEGTRVVTDIVFLRKRVPGEPARHADPDWLKTGTLSIDGADVSINNYFLSHPEMVLGTWSRADTLYGGEGFSVAGNGDLSVQLREAMDRLPRIETGRTVSEQRPPPAAPAFVPPPPLKHVGEGSFFVGDDMVIRQIEGAQTVPVVYSGVTQRANGTLVGKRLGALIELRDLARRVLQSQNEGWPEDHRHKARESLNRAYDRFVMAYGPINKTTFTHAKNGSTIRRMPNVVKFREDPDAMLVLSLEEYDEVTGKATKSAILHKDVVGKHEPVTSVRSAEEGLLVSLNQKGFVDIEYIAQLWGHSEAEIISALGELIYRNPETRGWETADDYLSGNVRDKLAVALKAGPEFARNAEALAAVQPPDVLPGDIDANLGAPWIPTADIEAFAADLFRVEPGQVRVGHLVKDASWSVDPTYVAEQSVAAVSEYGTPRINGIRLLELALNLKTPVIYDVIESSKGEQRVLNQEETLAAREKQKLVKERFKDWVFRDPDRTERLVRLYNDTYNNLRPRLFDGSHLDFPGLNQTISLRPHQNDAVWRGMSSGNCLLAHCVGAGKTFTMAATGMKLKQAGLVKKPMYVVPNHMLEQFAREFMQLYPNARLLVATKDDMAKERRKFLTAKIASGEWDGIIVTHSSFERIGMSNEYQAQFLREQIREYEDLLCDATIERSPRGQRNMIKFIEKQKANREAKLEELLAADKKDDGLVFDELGVDHLFVDEAHYFKNLDTPTKMDRVAGIQTGGSERAFDLFMKCRYLDQRHAGHGVTFATGTPISNTMVEMYTMQRFLDPKGLKDRGIEHFDAWAATFGEVVDTMEISPDGASLRPRSRFAKFINLPELQQMFRQFSDVQTAQMLNLPRPRLRDGKPSVVACPMSQAQGDIQQQLVERYETIRSTKVDPRQDNALAITTDGRKLALDARLLSPDAEDHPDSKVNALVENVHTIYRDTTASRGTQMVFCDLGVNETAWGFSVYDEIIAKLVAKGVPKEQIANIGDADTDAKKQVLFEKVRNGSVRVLLGSTQKMGVGTNVQKRLVALHHLDAPWKPAEVEQREGRILRQGNQNEEVAIYRYVTEGSFDAYMWQALETKARFISQVITGNSAVRQAEDIGGQELSYAEVKAIASGNPAVLTLAEADAELQRLAILRKNHADEQFLARRSVRELPNLIATLQDRLDKLTADQTVVDAHSASDISLGGKSFRREDVLEVLGSQLNGLPRTRLKDARLPLGTYRGLAFGVFLDEIIPDRVWLQGAALRTANLSKEHHGPRAVLNALDRIVKGLPEQQRNTMQDRSLAEQQLSDYQSRLGKTFEHEAYFTDLANLRDQLKQRLAQPHDPGTPVSPDTPPPGPSAGELSARIKALKSANTIESASRSTSERTTATSEEPVTARIRRLGSGLPDVSVDEGSETGESEHEAQIIDPAFAIPVAATDSGNGRGRIAVAGSHSRLM